MTMTDPLADLLTRIRNAQMRGKADTVVLGSRMNTSVLSVLRQEGFIASFEQLPEDGPQVKVAVKLKYWRGAPAVREIKRISKPGRRVYAKAGSIPPVKNGLGISIVSTSKGVMTDHAARETNVGGEVICSVF